MLMGGGGQITAWMFTVLAICLYLIVTAACIIDDTVCEDEQRGRHSSLRETGITLAEMSQTSTV